jgi:hypothetical protein
VKQRLLLCALPSCQRGKSIRKGSPSSMHILILGINHQIQRPFGSNSKACREFVQEQKSRYVELLHELIQKHEINFVGEEANRTEESIAKDVCKEEGCCYVNIEMTAEERTLRKIPNQYNEDDALSDAEKARGNRERERYMVEEVLTNAQNSDNILVICGNKHSAALAEGFRAVGHSVEIDDPGHKGWYVDDWFDHMMHNL